MTFCGPDCHFVSGALKQRVFHLVGKKFALNFLEHCKYHARKEVLCHRYGPNFLQFCDTNRHHSCPLSPVSVGNGAAGWYLGDLGVYPCYCL